MKKSTNTLEAEARIKESKKSAPGYKPWYVNMISWVITCLSVVAILAMAVKGLLDLMNADLSDTVQLGVSVFVVALLASKAVEFIFAKPKNVL